MIEEVCALSALHALLHRLLHYSFPFTHCAARAPLLYYYISLLHAHPFVDFACTLCRFGLRFSHYGIWPRHSGTMIEINREEVTKPGLVLTIVSQGMKTFEDNTAVKGIFVLCTPCHYFCHAPANRTSYNGVFWAGERVIWSLNVRARAHLAHPRVCAL